MISVRADVIIIETEYIINVMCLGRADVIIIETEYIINVMCLNHPQITPCLPPSMEKLSSKKSVLDG